MLLLVHPKNSTYLVQIKTEIATVYQLEQLLKSSNVDFVQYLDERYLFKSYPHTAASL